MLIELLLCIHFKGISFYSVQVLTQEDWNAVLYDAMRATSKWASVYFVVLMIIGNYILFNLLVAILVEGFSTETVSDIYFTAIYYTIFSYFNLRLISSSILHSSKFF